MIAGPIGFAHLGMDLHGYVAEVLVHTSSSGFDLGSLETLRDNRLRLGQDSSIPVERTLRNPSAVMCQHRSLVYGN